MSRQNQQGLVVLCLCYLCLAAGCVGGIVVGSRHAAEKNRACVAALDDYRDSYRTIAQGLGSPVPVSRTVDQLKADLTRHDTECRS